MTQLSISRAWQESKTVLRRDGRLIAAVGLALIGLPLAAANLLFPPVLQGVPPAGPWLLVAFLSVLVSFAGLLALIKLALGPHVSVSEAISSGSRRLLPFVAGTLILVMPLALLATTVSVFSGSTNSVQAQQLAPGLFFVLVILFSPLLARFLVLPAVSVAESGGPISVLRRTWTVGRGHGLRLLGAFLLAIVAWLVVEIAFNFVFGAAILLLLGQPEPMSLSRLAYSLGFGLLRTVEAILFGVMLARIYVQLSGDGAEASVPSSGT